MKIQVIQPSEKKSMSVFGIAASCLLVSAVSLAGGYWAGEQKLLDSTLSPMADAKVIDSSKAVAEIDAQVSSTEMDVLTKKLGQLQGHISRLDALGQKLVTMGKLQKGEFDFSKEPPVGGPETQDQYSRLDLPELQSSIDRLARQIEDRENQLTVLEQLILNHNLEVSALPAGRPIKSGWMSSGYGKRTSPFTGRRTLHSGIDFAGKYGSPVISVAQGVVTYSGRRGHYGILVEIDHGNGYVTRYGHNSKAVVEVGDVVKPGQTIARMGSTGRSTGPHVHYEVLKHGKKINPNKFVHAKR